MARPAGEPVNLDRPAGRLRMVGMAGLGLGATLALVLGTLGSGAIGSWPWSAGSRPAADSSTCARTLPALNPRDSRIEILSSTGSVISGATRITYRVVPSGAPTRQRFVECRFTDDKSLRSGRRLSNLVTESGPMTEASLYFLRRFHLAGDS